PRKSVPCRCHLSDTWGTTPAAVLGQIWNARTMSERGRRYLTTPTKPARHAVEQLFDPSTYWRYSCSSGEHTSERRARRSVVKEEQATWLLKTAPVGTGRPRSGPVRKRKTGGGARTARPRAPR